MLVTVIKAYCRAVRYLVELVGKSVSFVMPMLALVVAFEVFARYVLNKPTIWAYDLSLFMFGYIALLGGAYAQQKKAHINVDIVYLSVSPNTKRVFNLISFSLALFFALVVISMCLDKFSEALEFNYRRQSEWAPSMHHFWLMVVVACSLLAAQFSADMLADLYYLVRGRELIDSEENDDEY